MSNTPRTEAEIDRPRGPLDDIVTVDANFAAQLERELNAANERIKRLGEAGDRMRLFCADPDDCFAWDKAKEAKL